jgi:arylsulfatase A-like enzyme
VVDDLGTALEVYGGLAITPNLKRLAAKGTQMRSAFVSIAVCAPSRTAQGC